METFEADPDAEAVMLYNYGEAVMELGTDRIEIAYVFHKRIKILSESGFDWAEISIPYHKSDARVANIQAITYNVGPEGKVEQVKMEKRDIFDEKVSGKYHRKNFTLPQVKVGSVIEYKYKIISDAAASLRPFYFQRTIPVVYSEYKTYLSDIFDFVRFFDGELRLTSQEEHSFSEQLYITGPAARLFVDPNLRSTGTVNFRGKENVYILKDAPALIAEPYMTNIDDYLFKINHQIRSIRPENPNFEEMKFMTTWAKLSESYLSSENGGKQIESTFLRKVVNNQGGVPGYDAAGEPMANIQAIFEYVRGNMRWDKRYRLYADSEGGLHNAWKEKEGSSSEINMMIIAMLQEAGFEAHPVLISTRSNGAVNRAYPIRSQFNHLICQVVLEEGFLLLDGITDMTQFGVLPISDLNHYGFRLSEKDPQWISVEPHTKAEKKIFAKFTINEEGQLVGSLKNTHKGYESTLMRGRLTKYPDDVSGFFKEEIVDDFADVELTSHKLTNVETTDKPLGTQCELVSTDYVNMIGDFIYFKPILCETTEENPLQLEERSYPVDFACPVKEDYTLIFTIPEGYEVESVPEPAVVTLPDGAAKFQYQAKVVGPSIQLISKININQVLFMPDEYAYIKQFFDLITKKQTEQIVLKKKS